MGGILRKLIDSKSMKSLIHLFTTGLFSHRILILNILKELVKTNATVIESAIEEADNELRIITFDISENKLISFFLNFLIKIRENMFLETAGCNQVNKLKLVGEGDYDLSQGILKLLHSLQSIEKYNVILLNITKDALFNMKTKFSDPKILEVYLLIIIS